MQFTNSKQSSRIYHICNVVKMNKRNRGKERENICSEQREGS